MLLVLLKEFMLSCCKIHRVYIAFSLVQSFELIIKGKNKTPIGFFPLMFSQNPMTYMYYGAVMYPQKRYITWIFSC